MLVMKYTDNKRKDRIVELLKAGCVKFDARDGWLLVTPDIGKRGWKADLFWVHPTEINVTWVREFAAY